MPFPLTRWTVITVAGQDGNPAAEAALAELCKSYWYPVYAYVRRTGLNAMEAEDLTQEFFLRFLEKRQISHADRAKGRFRSFLLTAVKHFLADESDRRNAQKRGGGQQHNLPMNLHDAEKRYSLELATQDTPESLFEREWARTLMLRVKDQVEATYDREGRADLFARFKGFLPGSDEAANYAGVAEETGMTEGAVKVAVHRLRRRYREIFYAEIATLVASPELIEEEVRHLMQALRN